ncbi:TPA: transposase, partial [Enterobacter asburiae]|nr:transposase [Enterobacter asburiae]
MTHYTEDGRAEAENYIPENALWMVSLGRKNFLFFGSENCVERVELRYSLIGTCKLNGVFTKNASTYVILIAA